MLIKRLTLLLFIVVVQACATKGRPVTASNYDTELLAPHMADDLVLMEKKIFEHPALGTMLRYLDQSNPTDNITIYIYPIDKISWENRNQTLNSELRRSLAEIDQAVVDGHYKARNKETISDFKFVNNERSFSGKKAQLNIINQQDQTYYSDIFLFVAKDKFIKFRTSFNGEQSHFWTGDEIVKSILPGIDVPPESSYMKELRQTHREKVQKQLYELLTQPSGKESN